MKDVFDRADSYKDFILKRSDFILKLRTDELVVDFVDADAVKTSDRILMTLD